MIWTLSNLVIEIVAGIFGGHAVATLAKEHNFGALGHTMTGAIGGAISGYFLQTRVSVVVDAAGELHQASDQVTQWFVQGITGLVAGAICTMGIGLAKHTVAQHWSGKG